MNGWLDAAGRAIVPIVAIASSEKSPLDVNAWTDTAFTGDLAMPEETVAEMGLSPAATVRAELGDGSGVVMCTHACFVEWFDERRQIEVLATDSEYPLLGVGLLRGHKLVVDYRTGAVAIQ